MGKITYIFIFFFIKTTSFSQEVPLLPVSWEMDISNTTTPIILPPLNLENVHREDSINDLDKSLPWRYGITRPIQLNIHDHGTWTELPNGDKIWQVAIQSSWALNLSLNFNEFYLPKGSRLQLYNDSRTDISRTYTHSENTTNQLLGSWFVEGDIIWVEYFQPASAQGQLRLEIGSVIHGYRMGQVTMFADGMRGLNDSGDCNYDVNCNLGEDFDDKKDLLKKAVALLNLGNGYLCSAVLMNNTQNDKTPYLLTANHCLENSNPAFWSLRFNWMSPNPVCGTGDDSTDIETNFTVSGATVKANNALSDFALVELTNPIPSSWDIAFAGWDNSDTNPLFAVGIHHPNGDIMKICRDDSGAVKENAEGVEVWLIEGISAGNGNGWEMGTTESGSSGSPLFDHNGRIIGQLYAGQSFCDGTQNNGDYDIYGRFGVSWNSGNSPQTRLMDWLDPAQTGQTTMETLQNILNAPDFQFLGELEIYPNPATTEITVMNNRYPNLTYNFYNMIGQRLSSGSLSNTMNTISIENLSEGVYFLHLTDEDSDDTVTKKIIVDRF